LDIRIISKKYRLENQRGMSVARRLFPPPVQETVQLPEPISETSSADQDTVQQSLERLISHIYKTYQGGPPPPTLGDYHWTHLDDISDMMSTGQIIRYEISTLFQPFAGPPGTPNRVIIFITQNRRKLYTIARYDAFTHKLLPAITS